MFFFTYSYLFSLITPRQHKLQFRPPFEEIRAKYYREMKKFISIPFHFRGIGDTGEPLIFPSIVERNAPGFALVYQKAEQLFKRLDQTKNIFKVYWWFYRYGYKQVDTSAMLR